MATYLILNIVFMIVVIALLRMKPARPSKRTLITLVILLVMTAVFDSIIIALSIVDYNPDKILGLYIGFAPIEDFFYALFAVIVVPLIWNGLALRKKATDAR